MEASMYLTSGQLRRRFGFHPATTQEKKEAHERVREICFQAADELVGLTGPPTREQALAITKLEEAMFWANAAIARGGNTFS